MATPGCHRVNIGDISKQPMNIIKETLEETTSNNERFWNLKSYRTKREDHERCTRNSLRELKQRLLNNSEQNDRTDEELFDLSRAISEVCDHIETKIEKKNTTEIMLTTTEKATSTFQQSTESWGTPKSNSGDNDEIEANSAIKDENSRQSLNSGPPRCSAYGGLPRCLNSTTKIKSPTCVKTRNEFGFKTSKTTTENDNRLTFLREKSEPGARTTCRGRRTVDEFKIKKMNISREEVLEKEEGKEEATDQNSQLLRLKKEVGDHTEHLFGFSGLTSGLDPEAATGFMKWLKFADNQKENGVKPRRGTGPDTVLCLDTSKSMEGERFQEMISIALDIVDGIEKVGMVLGIPENISVTTFGEDSKVVLHLTNDYCRVKDAVKSIHTAKGTTPMAGGLLVALAGVLGNTPGITSVMGIAIPARIIMISDGLGTPEHVTRGVDDVTDTKSQEVVMHNIMTVLHDLKRRGNRVYCVPVKHAKMQLLERISSVTRGKVFQPTDFPRIVRMTQDTVDACGFVQNILKDSTDGNEVNIRKRLESIYDKAKGGMGLLLHQHKREDVLDLSMFLKLFMTEQAANAMLTESDSDLPPLGTRVRRGPGWHYPDHQDSHGPGTVFSHDNGMVWVEWDNNNKNRYRYKMAANREIVEVDEPRILKDQLIATGCRVKRGANWRPELNNQDGGPGNMGTVIRVHGNGIVDVCWDNKTIADYLFGFDGQFDLELCNEAKPSRSHQSRDLPTQNEDDLLIESFSDPVEIMNRRNKLK